MWKDIPKFDGYQVSDSGEVRTHNKVSSSSRYPVRKWKDRVLKPKMRKDDIRGGDARVDLWKDGKPHGMKISRLVAFTFLNEDIDNHDLTVNHKDGNWRNNNLSNLEIISLKDNINHGFDNGLYSSSKKVIVINKKNLEENEFRSMVKASNYMGYCDAYVCSKARKNSFENQDYSWVVF